MIYELAIREPHRAQIESPTGQNPRILDVGYGHGYWLLDMATKHYPSAHLVGIDIAPTEPGLQQYPTPKCDLHFLSPVDFMCPDWQVPRASFDIIHMSQLCGSVLDWGQLCYNALQ